MPDLEFGLRAGLSRPLVRDNSQEMVQMYQLQKQHQIEQENKAKMFADDFDYKSPINEFDRPLVNNFSRGVIKDAGTFIRNNPGWERDINKRIEYKQYIRSLKDNEHLNRALQTDSNWQAAQKDMADLKYANVDFTPIKQQYSNYSKYGNQDGDIRDAEGKPVLKAFSYTTPAPPQDTTKLLIDLAKDTQYDEQHNFGYQNSGLKQSVSDSRKKLAVEHALASDWAPQLKKDYQAYLGSLQGQEKTNAKTINEFTQERMEPYFQANKIEKAYEIPVIKSPSGGAGGNMTPSMWNVMHQKAVKVPGTEIEFNPKAMDETFANKYGEYNLDNTTTPSGDKVNLGMVSAASTGKASVNKFPGGKIYGEHKVLARIPVDVFEKLGDKYNDMIDEEGLGQFTPGASSQWSIKDKYKKDYTEYIDDKGKKFVQFVVKQKYDPDNVRLADNYSNAANVAPHKENPYDNSGEEEQITIVKRSPDGTQYQGSDGHIYDAKTNKLIQ